MKALFQNKLLTYGLLALTLILVVMVCVLLVQLTQLSAFNSQVEYYNDLIRQGELTEQQLQEKAEFVKTYEYIYERALALGWIPEGITLMEEGG